MATECKEFHPYPYQRFCIQHIIDHPVAGLFVDMGMGKTVMTLTAFNYLKYYAWQIQRCLVIAPKKVAEATWRTEISGWQHLRHLRCSEVLGTATQRRAAMAVDADVYVTNRDNVQWLVKEYGKAWPFDMVVLDESSSFKNHQAKRFKALRAMRPKIKRIVELTGTPSPHGLMDLWAQVYLLDGGQRLGRTISVYRDMYFEPDKRSRSQIFTYKARRGAADAIYAAISDICISLSSDDYLTLTASMTRFPSSWTALPPPRISDWSGMPCCKWTNRPSRQARRECWRASCYSSAMGLCTMRRARLSPSMTASWPRWWS